MNFDKFNEKLSEREVIFHDKWANLENINNIDVYKLFESITAVENKFIISHMGTLKDKKLLDIGCGLGESSVYFALNGAEVTAVDISPEMVKFTNKLSKKYNVVIQSMVCSATEMNFEHNFFDFIYCANLLHHLPVSDRFLFLNKVQKFLKNKGWFYSWDPLAYNPVINVYRRNANRVRSIDETPLKFNILKDFNKNFSKVYHREFWLTTLVLFLKYYFVDKYDPNKIRYWKEIYKERTNNIGWWFNTLQKIDNLLLKLPYLNKLAWNIVICAQK